MPTMIKIEADPKFKPVGAAQVTAFETAKAQGVLEVDHTTGMDNIRLSGGMYRVVTEEPQKATVSVKALADYTTDELKVMMLQLGIKTEKQMKKSDIVALIQSRIDDIEVVDDAE